MCRNIRPLFNFEPPATDDEESAPRRVPVGRARLALPHPSQANAAAFDRAVDDVAKSARTLLAALVTNAEPRDRGLEAEKARARNRVRFGAGLAGPPRGGLHCGKVDCCEISMIREFHACCARGA